MRLNIYVDIDMHMMHNIPIQVGSWRLHCPLVWHSLTREPWSRNPGKHSYVAVSLTWVPERDTRPLSGALSTLQDTPWQKGALPDHTPFSWQDRDDWPMRLNPEKQVYVAVDPGLEPSMSTRPFWGGSSWPHNWATEVQVYIYIYICMIWYDMLYCI